ncbi:MAG: hypothetical protein DRI24_21105 [Deltaproteobacteria bacterium]|nr:MAG: hypothetical protein DRI24_21105 [Deltaproteobacteria bacterium]
MADRKPLKQRDPNDPTVGLATFENTDTVGIEHGGTGGITQSEARTNLDVYSKSESDGNPPASHTHIETDVTDLDKYTQLEVDAGLALKKDDFTENSAFNKTFGAVAGTVTEGDDARLSDSRPPTAHTHTESEVTDLDKYTQLEVDNKDTVIQNQVTTNSTDIGNNAISIGDNASDISDNALAITTKEPIITPKNSAFNKSFGNISDTVTEGNDPRLSDNRDPNAHVHPQSDVTDLETDLSDRAVWKGEWVSAFYAFNE